MEDIDDFLNKTFSHLEKTEKKQLLNKKTEYRRRYSSLTSIEANINTKSELNLNKNSSLELREEKREYKLQSNFINVITQDNLYSSIQNHANNICLNKEKELKDAKKTKVINESSVKSILSPFFPSEKIYSNEINDNKSFLLDKFINQEKEKKKKIKKRRIIDKYSNIVEQLEKTNVDYEMFSEINKLWLGYISELLTMIPSLGKKIDRVKLNEKILDKDLDAILGKLLKADMTGALLKVIDSVNKNNINIMGYVVFESKNCFLICRKNKKDRLYKVCKKGSIFKLYLYNEKAALDNRINQSLNNSSNTQEILYSFTLIGDNFDYKSTERTKAKFKK